MRNLKKFLALVLAMMMVMGLMVTANAARLEELYDDSEDVTADYAEAVNVLTQLKIFKGDSGNFMPKRTITRAEIATLVYRVITGDVTDAQVGIYTSFGVNVFDDVTEEDVPWAVGAINYAANGEYVVGDGNGNFFPRTDINGYQLLAILLRVLGYGKNGEYQGPGWEITTATNASELGLLVGIVEDDGAYLGKPVSREVVAQILYNAIQTEMVKYSIGMGYDGIGKDLIELVDTDVNPDKWGVPSHTYTAYWNKVPGHKGTATIGYDQVAKFGVAMDECDIVDEDRFSVKEGNVLAWYVDGNLQTDTTGFSSGDNARIEERGVGEVVGAQGVITEIYAVPTGYYVVQYHTWLAKVTKVDQPDPDKNGHEAKRTIDFDIYVDLDVDKDGARQAGTDENWTVEYKVTNYENAKYSKNEYVLVTINKPAYDEKTGELSVAANSQIAILGNAPQVTSGTMDDYENYRYPDPATMTIGEKEEKYPESDRYFLYYHDAGNKEGYTYFGDAIDEWGNRFTVNGNIIGQAEKLTPDDYLVIEIMQWNHDGLKSGNWHASAIAHIGKDGSETDEIVIASVNGVKTTNSDLVYPTFDFSEASADYWKISDNPGNNARFYKHLFTYDVNEDGSYNIYITHKAADGITPAVPDNDADAVDGEGNPTGTNGNNIIDVGLHTPAIPSGSPGGPAAAVDAYGMITKGEANIYEIDNMNLAANSRTLTLKAIATNNTVYMIQKDDGCYEKYIGKDNVPSTIGDMCVVTDGTFATLVLVTNIYTVKPSNESTFLAYVANITVPSAISRSFNLKNDGSNTTTQKGFYAVDVYKLGDTKATTLYLSKDVLSSIEFAGAPTASNWTSTVNKTGIYQFTVGDSRNIITAIAETVTTTGTPGTAAPLYDDAGSISTHHLYTNGNSVAGPAEKTADPNHFMTFVNVQASKAIEGDTLKTETAWSWKTGFNDVNAASNSPSTEMNFNVTSSTRYIIVTKTDSNKDGKIDAKDAGSLKYGNDKDVDENDILTVAYRTEITSVGTVKLTPIYIYIFKTSGKVAEPEEPEEPTPTDTKVNDVDLDSDGSQNIWVYQEPGTTLTNNEALAKIIEALRKINLEIDSDNSGTVLTGTEYTFKTYTMVGTTKIPGPDYKFDTSSGFKPGDEYVMVGDTKVLLSNSDDSSDDYEHIGQRLGLTAAQIGNHVMVKANGTGDPAPATKGTTYNNKDTIEFGYFKVPYNTVKANSAVIPTTTVGTYKVEATPSAKVVDHTSGSAYYVKSSDSITIKVTYDKSGTAITNTDRIWVTDSTKYTVNKTAKVAFKSDAEDGANTSFVLTNFNDDLTAGTLVVKGDNVAMITVKYGADGASTKEYAITTKNAQGLSAAIDAAGDLTAAQKGTFVKLANGTYEAFASGTTAIADGDTVEVGFVTVTLPTATATKNVTPTITALDASKQYYKAGETFKLAFKLAGTVDSGGGTITWTPTATAVTAEAKSPLPVKSGTQTKTSSVAVTAAGVVTVTLVEADVLTALEFEITYTVTGTNNVTFS